MANLKNDLFLRALTGESVERPPVWLMRQAGRILPQYRAIRGSLSGFKELLSRTDLAAEVTVQPVDELGVDAAIIFSDILVIPECMGFDYSMVEKRGPLFEKVIESGQDVKEMKRGKSAAEELEYVFDAIRRTKILLDDRVPLIGFSGAPWTLLAYMVEGSGSKTFSKAKKFLYQEETLAHEALSAITDTVIEYLKLKIENGVNAIQIFDSWAGILTPDLYDKFALPYIRRICEAIDSVPTIVFAKGAWFSFDKLGQLPCNGLGVDWTIDPTWARSTAPDKILQGNLDPCFLYASEKEIEQKTKALIKSFGRSHIANLGHGVYPDTPLNAVKTFVNTVKSCNYSS
jgi:uroporphyrinogen decarboxylase